MKNLESRVTELESLISSDDTHSVKVVLLDVGETVESARQRYDIADSFTGKLLVVSFVAAGSR